jgi:Formate hydrogenlyase subunit 6/NADH:ubiquinone oxidoreductase 23 kD subunit (chain I)
MSLSTYISGIFTALKSLIGGMKVTWKQFWSKKVTMEYPENRDTLVISDRWRAELIMPHDENNEHACTACGICMKNCPNGTIKVISEKITTPEGKTKIILDKHLWDYGMCTFCNLCVITCPSDAIVFNNDFEGAVFDRTKFLHRLNHEGSKMRERVKGENTDNRTK